MSTLSPKGPNPMMEELMVRQRRENSGSSPRKDGRWTPSKPTVDGGGNYSPLSPAKKGPQVGDKRNPARPPRVISPPPSTKETNEFLAPKKKTAGSYIVSSPHRQPQTTNPNLSNSSPKPFAPSSSSQTYSHSINLVSPPQTRSKSPNYERGEELCLEMLPPPQQTTHQGASPHKSQSLTSNLSRGRAQTATGSRKDPKKMFQKKFSKKEGKKKGVFGLPIEELQEQGMVPLIMLQCIRYLTRTSDRLQTEGLFRVSPNYKELDDLKKLYTDPCTHVDLEQTQNVHNVCGLLKAWFSELPDPLFPFDVYQPLIDVFGSTQDHDVLVDIYRKVLMQMREERRCIILMLFEYFSLILQYQEENKMTASNISIVFGPNLLRPLNPDAQSLLSKEPNAIIEFFVENYEQILPDVQAPNG